VEVLLQKAWRILPNDTPLYRDHEVADVLTSRDVTEDSLSNTDDEFVRWNERRIVSTIQQAIVAADISLV
jgi:hypothetical protein